LTVLGVVQANGCLNAEHHDIQDTNKKGQRDELECRTESVGEHIPVVLLTGVLDLLAA
jgi:hypothetical protein